MKTILYQMAHSPFCIPISQALLASSVPFETIEVPNWDRSEILTLTKGSYYTVPLLVDDGRVIYESGTDTQDVARYVDSKWARGRLFPPAIEAVHLCTIEFLENELEARTFKLADIHYIPAIKNMVHRGMVIRHKERKFGRGCIDAWQRDATSIRAEADQLLARFETTFSERAFLFGDVPVYADFLLFGVLGNLTHKGWNQLSSKQSALAVWQSRISNFRWQ
jgi:glutathione S-transferase